MSVEEVLLERDRDVCEVLVEFRAVLLSDVSLLLGDVCACCCLEDGTSDFAV